MPLTPFADEQLQEMSRDGDRNAYGELWRRHWAAGRAVATRFAQIADPDDIVQEAFALIYSALSRDKGPQGAFRPYLYRTVRNVAVSWSRKAQADPVGGAQDLDLLDAAPVVEDDGPLTLVGSATHTAFVSLPDRWRTVLWYTAVEGMPPREAAPLLGLSANGVSALAARAREGLRVAWLDAHRNAPTTDEQCRQTVERIASLDRGQLPEPERRAVEMHLLGCFSCSEIRDEVEDVTSRLRLVLLPLVLGLPALVDTGLLDAGLLDAGLALSGPGSVPPPPDPSGTLWGATIPPPLVPTTALGAADGPGGATVSTLARTALVSGVMIAVTVGTLIGHDALVSGTPPPPVTRAWAPDDAVPAPVPPAQTPTVSLDDEGGDPVPPTIQPSPVPPTTTAPGRQPIVEDLPLEPSTTPPAPADPAESADLAESAGVAPPSAPPESAGPVDDAPSPPQVPPEPPPTVEPPVPPSVPEVPEVPGTDLAPPTLDARTREPVHVAPVLSGTGVAGATVEILDHTLHEDVGTTVVAPDGRWSVRVSTPTAPSMTYTAVQVVDGSRSAPSEPTTPYHFETPVLLSPSAGETVGFSTFDHNHNGIADEVEVTFSGVTGLLVEIVFDGTTTGSLHPLAGLPLMRYRGGLTTGEHQVALRYVDPATGAEGAWVEQSFTISQASPG